VADRPQNFWQVLAQAGSAGLGDVGKNFRADQQQEKQNALQMMMMGMQATEHEQSMERGRQAQLLAANNIKMSNMRLADAVELKNMTPDQIAAKRAAADIPYFKAIAENVSNIDLSNWPAGTTADFGPFSLKSPDAPKLPTDLEKARTDLLKAQTITEGQPTEKTLSASDQIIYNVMVEDLGSTDAANRAFAKFKQTSKEDSPEAMAVNFYESFVTSLLSPYNMKTPEGRMAASDFIFEELGVDMDKLLKGEDAK